MDEENQRRRHTPDGGCEKSKMKKRSVKKNRRAPSWTSKRVRELLSLANLSYELAFVCRLSGAGTAITMGR
eukprot:gene18129-5734_t